MTHICRLSLVSNLDKAYQQLENTVPHDSEQIFGDDLPQRIQGIKNNKQLFEKEKKHIVQTTTKKSPQRFPQNSRDHHYHKRY